MAKGTTFTAPNGETKNSKTRTYTDALIIFNPKEPWAEPRIASWHTSHKLAAKASGTRTSQGFRCIIVPVTSDGSIDNAWTLQIFYLRTQQDIDNIPAMRILAAEESLAQRKTYLAECEEAIRLKKTTEFISMDDLVRYADNARRGVEIAEHRLETVRAEYAPEPAPVNEMPEPKDSKKVSRRTFVQEIASAVQNATVGGTSLTYTPSDYSVTVERTTKNSYKFVKVGLGRGNYVEIHIPFTAGAARRIAVHVWELIELMHL